MRACKSWCERRAAGVWVVGVLALGASVYGQTMEWVPVSSTGPATIVGNEITMSLGGVQVRFDIFISGWGDAPGAPSLGAYVGKAVGTDMLGVNANPPNPGVNISHPTQVACVLDGDCSSGLCGSLNSIQGRFCDVSQPAFQITNVCLDDNSQACSVGTQCPGTPVCIRNPAYILDDSCGATPGVALFSNGDYEVFGVCFTGGVVDPGIPRYAGSVRFDVPGNAKGTYTISFNPSIDASFLNDPNAIRIQGLNLVSGLLTVELGRCCFGLGDAQQGCREDVLETECSIFPAPRLWEPGEICPDNGGLPCAECVTTDPNACKDPTVFQEGNDNLCTSNFCIPLPNSIEGACQNDPLFDESQECCDPDTGQIGCVADCDGDGVLDINETDPAKKDCNFNGICNGDEIAACPASDPLCADCNANGLPDVCDLVEEVSTDCNSNNVPDECEPDCDNNGRPDECDFALGTPSDCNNNGVIDQCEIAEDSIAPGGPFTCTADCQPDCNNSGLPDSCDIARGSSRDCNDNGIPDECEIASGISPDCDSNGIPDECEAWACCADLDGDSFFEACGMFTEVDCQQQIRGNFRGPCNVCPEQTVGIIPEPGGEIFIHLIEAPIDCLAETGGRAAARGGCVPGVAKIDPWKSNSNAQMCHNFGVAGSPAIPADFFGPGSDSFTGTVCLVGTPLGITAFGDFGEADTLISRTVDPFDRCNLPSASSSTVDLEVVALSLVDDSDPVIVTFNGGQNPEFWTVAVDLSATTPPTGSLTATKTHCNGGTYTSVLNVLPRFTFTKVNDPSQVEVLDTGVAGLSPISLIQDVSAPWVHDIDPNLGLTFDPCSTFHPGISDTVQSVDCDCDGNTVRDKCDIENLTSLDCNLNSIPDGCDLSAVTSQDCNGNNVPDECELSPPAIPAAPHDIQKNRFASFAPANDACVAFRVELLDLGCSSTGKKCAGDADCLICDGGNEAGLPCFIGSDCPTSNCVASGETCEQQSLPIQLGWVDDPFVPDSDRVPPGTFSAAVVKNMPALRMWPEGVVHVGDCETAPAQTYGFSATVDGVLFSPRLVLGTTPKPEGKFWGDVVGNFDVVVWSAPNGLVNVNDVSAMLKFITLKASPHITVLDLAGEVPNWLINATDLQLVLRAFKGKTYPPVAFTNKGNPADCP